MPQFPFKWPPVTQLVAVVCIIGWLLPAQVSNGPGAVSPKALPLGEIVRTFAVK